MRILELNGLAEDPDRGKGSHAWFEHPDDPSRATVVPMRPEISEPLLGDILKQAGKSRQEYEQRLREV